MKGIKLLAATALLISFGCNAGAYGDELTKCAIERTDESGKTALLHWTFIASSRHPENKASYMKNELLEALSEQRAASVIADTFGRACKLEADLAIKVEGKSAMANSVAALLYSAIDYTFRDSSVSSYMNETDKLFTHELKKVRERSERFQH